MRDKLTIWEKEEGYVIGWEVDGDEGLLIGEDIGPDTNDDDDRLTLIASRVLHGEAQVNTRVCMDRRVGAYVIESATLAERLLAAIRSEYRQWKEGRPWPEWAKTAHAAGWRPPKGWKP